MCWIFAMDDRPLVDPDGVDNQRYRAKILMRVLEEKRVEIVVPTIVISELLVPMTDEERQSFVARIQEEFHCPPFDLYAATIAAQLHADHKKFSPKDRYENRKILKADCLIIATAKSAGAAEFYSHDAKARNLASLVMKASDMPRKAPNFVVDQDIRGTLPPPKTIKRLT